MKRMILALAAVALMVAGCGSGGAGSFEQVVYHLSGGVAGLDQQLVIKGDGTFETSVRGRVNTSGTLPEDELEGLKERLRQIDWEAIQERYVDPGVKDALLDTVTVDFGGETRQFTVGTEAEAPEALVELIGYMKTLMARHRMA